MVHFSLLKNDDNSTIAVIARLANSIASYGLMTINSKYAEAGQVGLQMFTGTTFLLRFRAVNN